MTKDEWEWIKPRLTVGCTFKLTSKDTLDDQNWAIGNIIECPPTSVGWCKHSLVADFHQSNPDWVSDWDYYYYVEGRLDDISDFTWPDGSPITPFIEYSGVAYNPIHTKIKSLQTRFANKSLPKTKMKALPLPT